jgi:beta-glucosidase
VPVTKFHPRSAGRENSFTASNTGNREGADVAQLYLTEAAGEKDVRLLGFERVELHAGELRQVTVTADPRLLASFDAAAVSLQLITY